jgi:hypothetical protein
LAAKRGARTIVGGDGLCRCCSQPTRVKKYEKSEEQTTFALLSNDGSRIF